MNRALKHKDGGHDGMILINVLMILSLLVGIGFGARVMMQNDYKIVANVRRGTEAFYLAESGIAWSMEAVAEAIGHPPILTSYTQSFGTGNFFVSFSAPTVVSRLSAKTVVRSIASVGSASQILEAQLTKAYDLADAAVGLRGNAGAVNFASTSFVISGLDHDPMSGLPIVESRSRPGISVAEEALAASVAGALADSQQSQSVVSGSGLPAIAPSHYLAGPIVEALANILCESVQASAISADGTLTVQGENWGTPKAPQLRCIAGMPGPGDSVNLTGTVTGAGILVVKDAALVLSGAFRWDGLIIVSGNNVSVTVTGAGDKAILGALMVNETGTPGSATAILDLQGTIRLLFSRSALGGAEALFPPSALESAYSALPFTVRRDYWRIVSSN